MEQEQKEMPSAEQTAKEIPNAEQPILVLPPTDQEHPDLPKMGDVDNMVVIGDQIITIKPTKLKYQRNKTA